MTNRMQSKDEVLLLMNGVRASFLYGHFVEALAWKKVPDVVGEMKGTFTFEAVDKTRTGLSLDFLADQMRSDAKVIRGNFFLFLNFESIRFFYELAHTYCQGSGQSHVYAAAAWSQFARVLRNVVCHGDSAIFSRWPDNLKKKGITSVTWNGVTIRESDAGAPFGLDVVNVVQLQEEIYTFTKGLK